jgi:hypothetical protein
MPHLMLFVGEYSFWVKLKLNKFCFFATTLFHSYFTWDYTFHISINSTHLVLKPIRQFRIASFLYHVNIIKQYVPYHDLYIPKLYVSWIWKYHKTSQHCLWHHFTNTQHTQHTTHNTQHTIYNTQQKTQIKP